MMSSLLNWFRPRTRTISKRAASRKTALCKLHAEVLEDRTVPSAGWAIGIGGTATSVSWGVAIDSQQNSVITGYFAGSTDFDPGAGATTLTSAGGLDIYVAKYTPGGALAWAQRFGGTGVDTAFRVAFDASGDVYIVGQFQNSVAFGSITLNSAGGYDAFVAKLDGASGNAVWADAFGGSGNDQAQGIAVDAGGNVFACGSFCNTAAFGAAGSLTSAGASDSFVIRLDGGGVAQWARGMGCTDDVLLYTEQIQADMAFSVALDRAGHVYVSGRFRGGAVFGTDAFGNPVTMTSKAGGGDAFVLRMNPTTATTDWAIRMGSEADTINEYATAVAIDDRDADPTKWAAYVTGSMSGNNCDFGTDVFTSFGSDDAFVSKLDASTGAFTWTRQLGGAGQELGHGLALDGAGNIYTTGVFGTSTQTADFDPGPGTYVLTPGGFRDVYVSMLDADGNFAAAWQTTGNSASGGHNMGRRIAADANGNLWISGQFDDNPTIFPTGQTLIPSTNGFNGSAAFLMRLNAPHGAIHGTVYGDWNGNGIRNSNDPGLSGRTVYIDVNGNGQLNAGEPTATTNAQGGYSFSDLAAGTYNLRQVVPAGWTATAPAGGVKTVSVGDHFVRGVDFGQNKPTSIHTYSNNKQKKTSNGSPDATSTLSVSDVALIYDLNLTLNISNTKNNPLTIILTAPDGTKVTLLSNATVNGTLTFQTSLFDFKSVKGTWTLEVNGLAGGSLNSWSLGVLEPITP